MPGEVHDNSMLTASLSSSRLLVPAKAGSLRAVGEVADMAGVIEHAVVGVHRLGVHWHVFAGVSFQPYDFAIAGAASVGHVESPLLMMTFSRCSSSACVRMTPCSSIRSRSSLV